ncbi:MAG: hypothetical protein WC554_09940 [Clostridia bacterium]
MNIKELNYIVYPGKHLKERKTPLQSKRKITSMINLFEKCIDEKIVIIDVELSRIQTPQNVYQVDVHKNKIEKILWEKYRLDVNEPFD